MNNEYNIKLEIFEGPLDLLLYLVEKDEVDICSISVGRVCRQFLEYLNLMEELNIDLAGEYLVMAATLTRLKANELLPQEERMEAGPEGEIVNREQLIEQLLQYKKFKEAGIALRRLEDRQKGAFFRMLPEKIEWDGSAEETVLEASTFDLLAALKKIMEKAEETPFVHNVVLDDVKLDDRIEHIIAYMMDHEEAKFEDLFAGARTRMMIVVTFMGILELLKMEQIRLRQESQFGQIFVYRRMPEESAEPAPDVPFLEEEKITVPEKAEENDRPS